MFASKKILHHQVVSTLPFFYVLNEFVFISLSDNKIFFFFLVPGVYLDFVIIVILGFCNFSLKQMFHKYLPCVAYEHISGDILEKI